MDISEDADELAVSDRRKKPPANGHLAATNGNAIVEVVFSQSYLMLRSIAITLGLLTRNLRSHQIPL